MWFVLHKLYDGFHSFCKVWVRRGAPRKGEEIRGNTPPKFTCKYINKNTKFANICNKYLTMHTFLFIWLWLFLITNLKKEEKGRKSKNRARLCYVFFCLFFCERMTTTTLVKKKEKKKGFEFLMNRQHRLVRSMHCTMCSTVKHFTATVWSLI